MFRFVLGQVAAAFTFSVIMMVVAMVVVWPMLVGSRAGLAHNDFAYNACLARHGPKGYLGRPAHEVDLGRPSHEGHAVVPRRSGRMHLELPVGPLD